MFAGKSDIALQHTIVEPGGFVLEDTFFLVEAMKDLSPWGHWYRPILLQCYSSIAVK